jgi:membrane-associated protease RseP (regulator of RpoE activity)
LNANSLGIWAFVITLGFMIVFHEFGHYVAAKRFGMKVDSFFFGFGPKVFSWRRGETEFGVRALPLGGYVKIAGMNPFVPVNDEDRERVFGAKPSWQRAIVLASGSATHFVFAFILLMILYAALGLPETTTTIADVVRDKNNPSAAQQAGLQEGDRILSIQGQEVDSFDDVRRIVSENPGNSLAIEVKRDAGVVQLNAVPTPTEVTEAGRKETRGQLGILSQTKSVREPPHKAVVSAGGVVIEMGRLSVVGALSFFSPRTLGRVFGALGESGQREIAGDEPIGAVGGARLAGQSAAAGGFDRLVFLLAGVIIFIGVINLAPLPVLDGGWLVMLAYEKITKRKIDLRKMVPAMVLVFAFFIMLQLVLLYLDITRPIQNPFQ